jgi:ribosomal-protein-alanine N-acetyltransferase
VVPEARGGGIAGRAVTLACRWALTRAGLARVEALVEPDNLPSRRVLERSGFQLEGRLRSYAEWDGERVDMLLLSLIPADLA